MGKHQIRARHPGARREGKTIASAHQETETLNPYRRVALLGFMGAGKTTVGRILAPMLGWRFLDTDAMLVERHGASIATLFEEFGEPQFREWEAEIVAEALGGEQVVVALGGGAVEHPHTRELLFGDAATLTMFLEVSLAVSLTRCTEAGGAVRPVLADAIMLEHRYASRLRFYKLAQSSVYTEQHNPTTLAETIAALVRKARGGCNGDLTSV